jgi:hypothetical protein
MTWPPEDSRLTYLMGLATVPDSFCFSGGIAGIGCRTEVGEDC